MSLFSNRPLPAGAATLVYFVDGAENDTDAGFTKNMEKYIAHDKFEKQLLS